MKEQCPKCGNWVEGNLKPSIARKATKGVLKTVGIKGLSIIADSAVPGAGDVVGICTNALAGEQIDKALDKGLDVVTDVYCENQDFEFVCPICGQVWKKKAKSNILSSNNHKSNTTSSVNGSKDEIILLIKQCTLNKNVNDGCLLTYAQINVNKLIKNLQNQYGIQIYEWQINSCKNVKELVNLIETKKTCSSEVSSIVSKQELFNKEFYFYLENTDNIIKTYKTVDNYINKIDKLTLGCDNIVKSEFYFLKAITCLDYSLLHNEDNSLIGVGKLYINKADAILDDGEYKLIKLMFESLSVNHDAYDIVKIQHNLQGKCLRFDMLENTLFNIEYLIELYEKTRFYSLVDSVRALEKIENYIGASECLQIITELSDIGYQLFGYEFLMDYYYYGRKGLNVSKELGFSYAKKGYEIADFTNAFNPNITYKRSWLRCLERIAYAYLEGVGTKQDYQKAFELTTKAANLGSMYSAYNLGEIYELGRGVPQNQTLALEWYEKALSLGIEAAREKVEQLKTVSFTTISQETSSKGLSDDEKEYLEEVKMCLEEDNEISPKERRLLDRLRTKLNISEERAKELEESLKTPQLTEDEQEYLEEYKLCIEEDSEISSKERRLLDKLRDKLGISVERAKELERSFI